MLGELSHDLKAAVAVVGHRCPSAAIAVRMTRLAWRHLAISEPGSNADLIVWVEMDECATAATGAVIGRTPLGLRHMTPGDLGHMKITVVDVRTGLGVRVGVHDAIISKQGLSEILMGEPHIPDDEFLTVAILHLLFGHIALFGMSRRCRTMTFLAPIECRKPPKSTPRPRGIHALICRTCY